MNNPLVSTEINSDVKLEDYVLKYDVTFVCIAKLWEIFIVESLKKKFDRHRLKETAKFD